MKAVSAPQWSALKQFAEWFHQDFFVLFSDVQTGGAVYISNLDPTQRRSLHEELTVFLENHEGGSEKALQQAWLKLGVQAWPRRGNTRAELTAFLALQRV